MPTFDDTLDDKKFAELRSREEENLIRALSQKYGHEYINLSGASISTDAMKLVPEEVARKAMLVLFEKVHTRVSVAMRNPNNTEAQRVLDDLRAQGFEVTVYMTATAHLEHAWKRYADIKRATASQKGMLDIEAAEVTRLAETIQNSSDVAALIQKISEQKSARHISETLEVLLGGALALHASDIHIEPEESAVRIRVRLDGVLSDVTDMNQDVYKLLRSRLKLLSGLKLNVDDEAQDGRFTINIGERDIEIRTSVIPGAYGESVVMRILDPTTIRLNMERLGINETLFNALREELARPNGMVITTGPTGSGKTTSLYAFLEHIHTPEIKIITLEDPIEYQLEGIVQTQVGDDYTFASGLRSILRQDPDVIMVGEIRDQEVAETAINAALTGHLVLSTLHTNSAAGAFPRLIDLGVSPRTIGSAVNIALAQRLARKLCDACKKAYTPNETEAALIRTYLTTMSPDDVPETLTLYKPGKCAACSNTGHQGRIGLFEGIRVDKAVEETIIRDPRESTILEAAAPQGIPSMQEDGILKLIAGVLSFEELSRVTDLYDTRRGATAPEDTDRHTP